MYRLLLLSILIGSANVSAATVTWTGSVDSDWNTALNWDTSSVPTSADTAVFTGSASLSASTTVGTVTISSGGNLDLGGFTLQITEDLTLSDGEP